MNDSDDVQKNSGLYGFIGLIASIIMLPVLLAALALGAFLNSGSYTVTASDVNPNIQIAVAFFGSKKFTKEATSAIIGNLMQESDMDPKKVQLNGGAGKGLAQWGDCNVDSNAGCRWQKLIEFAENRDYWGIGVQLEFLYKEMEEYGLDLEKYKTSTGVDALVEDFCNNFEKPGKPEMEKRKENAHKVLEMLTVIATPGDYGLPVQDPSNFKVTSPFGYYCGTTTAHPGTDLGSINKSGNINIVAVADGEVVTSIDSTTGYGKHIDIQHASVYTRYGHLSQRLVNVGDHVVKGQVIGIEGTTGNSSGPHLHFEIGKDVHGAYSWDNQYSMEEMIPSIKSIPSSCGYTNK